MAIDDHSYPAKYPSLKFLCPVTAAHLSLEFGYLANEPMMTILQGDRIIAMLPREVLIAALCEGWGGNESGWWVDPGNN